MPTMKIDLDRYLYAHCEDITRLLEEEALPYVDPSECLAHLGLKVVNERTNPFPHWGMQDLFEVPEEGTLIEIVSKKGWDRAVEQHKIRVLALKEK